MISNETIIHQSRTYDEYELNGKARPSTMSNCDNGKLLLPQEVEQEKLFV